MKESNKDQRKPVLLTIIIATFNAEIYIKGCLDSIVENIKEPYELVIIDGQSQDKTLDLINPFKRPQDTLISERDSGIYDAMNKGIKYANGKWVIFLGADDRILPTFSNIFSQLNNTSSIYYGNCKNASNQLGGQFSVNKLAKMNLCHQAILYPITALKMYQFDLQYPVFADYLLNMQCWGDRSIIKTYVDIDIAYYHMEGFSATAADPAFRQDKPKLVKKHLGLIAYLKYRYRKLKESRNPASKFF